MLEARSLVRRFGGIAAVDDVSFTLAPGQITGLIGPNGAGKTTLFNLLARSLDPDRGEIRLDGQRIDRLRPDQAFARGLARTFQIPRPFLALSVLDNVLLAPPGQTGERFWSVWLAPRAVAKAEARAREAARAWIAFVGLSKLEDQPARVLSGGQRKLLELARVMAAGPRLLLLDEPGAGVAPALLETIVDRIATLNRDGLTVLVIEHNMDVISALCRTVMVMAEGRLLASGPPAEIRRNQAVIGAYLGTAG